MKLFKKNMILFLACSLLFLVACSFNIDEPVAIDEEDTSIKTINGGETPLATIGEGDTPVTAADKDSDIICVDRLPLVVKSVEDLKLAIEESASLYTYPVNTYKNGGFNFFRNTNPVSMQIWKKETCCNLQQASFIRFFHFLTGFST